MKATCEKCTETKEIQILTLEGVNVNEFAGFCSLACLFDKYKDSIIEWAQDKERMKKLMETEYFTK